MRKHKKRMRLPNGFGQITELKKANLRKPFRAMITVGKNKNGRPICKLLKPVSYFATYNEAYTALLEYHNGIAPQDESASITLEELYTKWSTEHFENLSDSRIRSLTSAWNYCYGIKDLKINEIKSRTIKEYLEIAQTKDGKRPSVQTIANIKQTLGMIFDYGIEMDYLEKNPAKSFKLQTSIANEIKNNAQNHIAFSDAEMKKLWSKIDDSTYVDIILIQCYSGWRPQELITLETANVNINDWSFVGGMKTENGKNRWVPIHSKIRPLVKKYYDEAIKTQAKYLFGKLDNYSKYKWTFKKIIQKLELNATHNPHDCRVEFVTLAKKYDLNEYAIKYIVGHSISDITEKTYTRRDHEWLRAEIEKIK